MTANQAAVKAGWALPGVFGTAIGHEYPSDGRYSLLYVGKSAGPLGSAVGSGYDQMASIRASTQWMTGFRNRSAFWQMLDRIDPTRRRIAWTNICKMDRIGGNKPPAGREWRSVSVACLDAFAEEIAALRPRVMLFATSNDYRPETLALIKDLGFRRERLPFDDGWTMSLETTDGRCAILTKHPQGWSIEERDRVVQLARQKLS